MMDWVRPGQMVYCIKEGAWSHSFDPAAVLHFPQRGLVYTIRSSWSGYGQIGIRLEEIRNPTNVFWIATGYIGEASFNVTAFRPVKQTSIESLRKLLVPHNKLNVLSCN